MKRKREIGRFEAISDAGKIYTIIEYQIYEIDNYIQALQREIQLWGDMANWFQLPVTTVHLGGGSPLLLSPSQLKMIFETLEKYFKIQSTTELAVESSSSQITLANIYEYKRLKISRIHLGVQTLSDPIRKLIGRREAGEVVKEKIKMLLSEQIITSVDMLYGLPMQSHSEFAMELKELIKCGLDGVALYELQITPTFGKLISKKPTYMPEKMLSYQMLVIGKKILNDAGYSNVYFNHYSKERDKNLYFTFPVRGEDCLAFGAKADAQLGDTFLRHVEYNKYLEALKRGEIGIDFGYIEDSGRKKIHDFELTLDPDIYFMSEKFYNNTWKNTLKKD